jgi:hypothetical protein
MLDSKELEFYQYNGSSKTSGIRINLLSLHDLLFLTDLLF